LTLRDCQLKKIPNFVLQCKNLVKLDLSRNQLKTLPKEFGNLASLTSLELGSNKFLHFPEVGIESSQRQELNNQDDYDQLFASYCREVLPQTLKTQEAILALVEEHQRVALTCFEGQHCQCHRSHLATAVAQLPNFKYAVEHL
jgi:uncharacterized protein (DUF488 family)